ncbi:MAG: NTP transferase domain-containing protein [Rhodothermales bacterium]|nr:NTP transferase domain-containing protein [Rhodothermales bacterium]
MKLIIPMAGRGTRVRPHSHVTPKPLLNVRGQNMVARIVDTFASVMPRGIDEGVFVLGPDFGQDVRDQLTEICSSRGMKASFAVQEEAHGTAHAVYCAEEFLDGEGIVVFADTLFYMDPGVDLDGPDVVAWVKEVEDPSRFGVAVRKGDKIVEFVEKPTELISNEALIGIYYVKNLSELRDAIAHLIEHDVRGHGREFQLTDAFDKMLKDGRTFTTATVTDWLDCGTIPALLETTGIILEREELVNPEDYPGCTINQPVYVGADVTLEGSTIGPRVSIEPGSVIKNSTLRNSIVFAQATVQNSNLKDSLVGRNAKVEGFTGSVNIGDHSEIHS